MEGYIYKRNPGKAGLGKNWKRRLFKLESDHISYETDTSHRGRIPYSAVVDVRQEIIDKAKAGPDSGFVIETKKRTYYLSAEARQVWVTAISEAVKSYLEKAKQIVDPMSSDDDDGGEASASASATTGGGYGSDTSGVSMVRRNTHGSVVEVNSDDDDDEDEAGTIRAKPTTRTRKKVNSEVYASSSDSEEYHLESGVRNEAHTTSDDDDDGDFGTVADEIKGYVEIEPENDEANRGDGGDESDSTVDGGDDEQANLESDDVGQQLLRSQTIVSSKDKVTIMYKNVPVIVPVTAKGTANDLLATMIPDESQRTDLLLWEVRNDGTDREVQPDDRPAEMASAGSRIYLVNTERRVLVTFFEDGSFEPLVITWETTAGEICDCSFDGVSNTFKGKVNAILETSEFGGGAGLFLRKNLQSQLFDPSELPLDLLYDLPDETTGNRARKSIGMAQRFYIMSRARRSGNVLPNSPSKKNTKKKAPSTKDTDADMTYLAGYLFKQGQDRLAKWKERWFVFEDGYLRYYQNKDSIEYKNEVHCDTFVNVVSNVPNKKYKNCFELKTSTGRGDFLLSARSPQIMERWVAVLMKSKLQADKVGYLKKTGKNSGFRKRFFILKGSSLFYFDNQGEQSHKGSIDLSADTTEISMSANEENAFAIEVHHPKYRKYELKSCHTDNEKAHQDVQSWIRALHDKLSDKKETSSSQSEGLESDASSRTVNSSSTTEDGWTKVRNPPTTARARTQTTVSSALRLADEVLESDMQTNSTYSRRMSRSGSRSIRGGERNPYSSKHYMPTPLPEPEWTVEQSNMYDFDEGTEKNNPYKDIPDEEWTATDGPMEFSSEFMDVIKSGDSLGRLSGFTGDDNNNNNNNNNSTGTRRQTTTGRRTNSMVRRKAEEDLKQLASASPRKSSQEGDGGEDDQPQPLGSVMDHTPAFLEQPGMITVEALEVETPSVLKTVISSSISPGWSGGITKISLSGVVLERQDDGKWVPNDEEALATNPEQEVVENSDKFFIPGGITVLFNSEDESWVVYRDEENFQMMNSSNSPADVNPVLMDPPPEGRRRLSTSSGPGRPRPPTQRSRTTPQADVVNAQREQQQRSTTTATTHTRTSPTTPTNEAATPRERIYTTDSLNEAPGGSEGRLNKSHPFLVKVTDATELLLSIYHDPLISNGPQAKQSVLDDTRNEDIGVMVRKHLCTAIALIVGHGMYPSRGLGLIKNTLWDIVVSTCPVPIATTSQTGVLAYRVMRDLGVNPNMDNDPNIKFRTFVCAALNHHFLHDWLVLLRQDDRTTQFYYKPDAFLRAGSDAVFVEMIRKLQPVSTLPWRLHSSFELRRRSTTLARKSRRDTASGRQAPSSPQQQKTKQGNPRRQTAGEGVSGARKRPTQVQAKFDNLNAEDDELAFKAGDVMKVIGQPDRNWLECEINGQQGLVPVTFVISVPVHG